MKKAYSDKRWKERSKEIIELDGNECSVCDRNDQEAVLQVHHERYIKGKKPWEYSHNDLLTLCKGCHAREHGIIRPHDGWDYVGEDDLEDRVGNCENCGTSIRYVFTVFHPNWEILNVGTKCCDNLTGNKRATEYRKFQDRIDRFIKSDRWKVSTRSSTHRIKQHGHYVSIWRYNGLYHIKIHGIKSRFTYATLKDAKKRAFTVIETGEMDKYLTKHNMW
jgi:hypothetical protein